MYYRTLEFTDPIHVQIGNISTHEVCFKPKSQKNVPAKIIDNCHP